MSWFASMLPAPESRDPLTFPVFFRDIVAPLLCYYATAVLVLTPNTRFIRLCALPLSLWTFYNGGTHVDLTKNFKNADRLVFWNQGLMVVYTVLSLRVLRWTSPTEPFFRVKTQKEATPQFYDSAAPPLRIRAVLVDAFDLCCNLRGIGWNWSQYLQIPDEYRPTNSATSFAGATLYSLIKHLLLFDGLQYSVQWFGPATIGSAHGHSIYDSSLPPLQRYTRPTMITFLTGMAVYSALQAGYDIATLFGVLVFRQDPFLWPPAFQSPWYSSSLTAFWAKRWHQLFRDVFIFAGGKPFSILLGRAGGIIGVFIVSGILHDIGLWGMGRGTDFYNVGGFFIVNGIGICLEHLWRKITGHRVDGYFGTIWTWLWVIGWAHALVEGWATKGLMGSQFFPQHWRLTTHIFGPLW